MCNYLILQTMMSRLLLRKNFVLIAVFVFSQLSISAQTDKRYGPGDYIYEIPEDVNNVFYVSPEGKPDAPGNSIDSPTDLETAVKKARTNDLIVLRGGVYRTGRLTFNQGFTMQPYNDEKPVIKGTYMATDWKKEDEGLWVTPWTYLFPGKPEDWWNRKREEEFTPLYRFNGDMVFIDGRFLQATGSKSDVDSNTFYIDYDKKLVYIGINPENKLIEITAFDKAIFRVTGECNGVPSDSTGPVIRGLEFTQFADTALHFDGTFPHGVSPESKHGKDVTGTILEDCKVSYCSRIGIYLMGDHSKILHCDVRNTSTEGVYILSSSDILLEGNVFSRNNIEHITGFFPAAVKIFNQCYRVTCHNNLITDLPESNGIWYDVGNVDGVFINNHLENIGINPGERKALGRFRSGFFLEISKGIICANNVFINCDIGSFILNSSNAKIYNNTYFNSTASFMRTERSAVDDHFGWHPATGPDVDKRTGHVFVNNLMIKQADIPIILLNVWQTDSLCGMLKDSQLKELDNNIYVRQTENDTMALIIWKPADTEDCGLLLYSPQELNKHYPDFEANSILLDNYTDKLLTIDKLLKLDVNKEFPEVNPKPLPENVQELLKWDDSGDMAVGANPR